MNKCFAELKKSKQVIHPQVIWNIGSKYVQVADKLDYLSEAEDIALRTGNFSCLDIILSMRDFAVAADQALSHPAFYNLWKETVPLETAK